MWRNGLILIQKCTIKAWTTSSALMNYIFVYILIISDTRSIEPKHLFMRTCSICGTSTTSVVQVTFCVCFKYTGFGSHVNDKKNLIRYYINIAAFIFSNHYVPPLSQSTYWIIHWSRIINASCTEPKFLLSGLSSFIQRFFSRLRSPKIWIKS